MFIKPTYKTTNGDVIINTKHCEYIRKNDLTAPFSGDPTLYCIMFVFNSDSQPVKWKYERREDRDKDFHYVSKSIRGV